MYPSRSGGRFGSRPGNSNSDSTQALSWQAPLDPLEPRQLLSTSLTSVLVQPAIDRAAVTVSATAAISGYTPSQIKTAYGISSISLGKNITANGSGQTIAIVDAYRDPNLANDYNTFDAKFGLPSPSITVVNSSGKTSPLPQQNSGWDQEIDLDVEWAHAMAPSAKLLLVEANSASLTDLLAAVNYARNAAGVSVVTMSWGASEFFGENNYDSSFTTPSKHNNVVFIAASGDDNANEWPSTSPNVLSVGGSTLYTSNSSGTYWYEGGWAGDGGGYSAFEAEPAYQEGAQQTGSRTTPDVSFDANPSSGFAIYDSTSYGGKSGWIEIGGTSAGAPQWAALVAIADQGRAAAGKATLSSGGLLTTLYDQYDPYNLKSSTYLASFHDVNYNLNGGYVQGNLGFFSPRVALNGYDLVTGLGSPRAPGLETALVASNGATATTSENATPGTKTTAKVSVAIVAPLSSPGEMAGVETTALFGHSPIAPPNDAVISESSAALVSIASTDMSAFAATSVLAIVDGHESPVAHVADIEQVATPAGEAAVSPFTHVAFNPQSLVDSAGDHLWIDPRTFIGEYTAATARVPQAMANLASLGAAPSWARAALAAVATGGFLWWWSDAERNAEAQTATARTPRFAPRESA